MSSWTFQDHITIVETSPGLYCVRVTWGDQVREDTELTHEDAWPTAVDLLVDMQSAEAGL